ncbi:hypothetical protein Dcar01_02230 [Deinococcus carri]|uniref:DUF4175 domain-containing protein n=1 Tax=Deinococcus carri TaxID=1211323 RepID=A0ABP9W812_9DEIO
MFGRRVPPHIVFLLSLLLAVLAGVAAFRYLRADNWLPGLLWGAVAVWFLVDAVRSYGWWKGR